jgi:nitrogen regulatory protein PII
MNKMVMVVYNEAMDEEVMDALGKCGGQNYTKLTSTFGKGTASGTHMGDDIWPGRNNILYVVCDERQAKQMLDCVRELRKKMGHEGIKAFLLPVEEIT